jgi:ketosteroid isomerase-like protein
LCQPTPEQKLITGEVSVLKRTSVERLLFDPEFERQYDEAAEDAIDEAISEEVLKGNPETAIARGVEKGRAVTESLKLGLPKGWLVGSLKNGDKVVNIGGFFSGHLLAVSEDRIEDATDDGTYTSRGEDLEDWLRCKLAFHRRVEAESQGKRIPAPDTRSESERVRPSEELDDELTEIDVKAIVEVLEGSPEEVVARALRNRTSPEGRALAAAYARKRRGEKGLGVNRIPPDPPFTAPPPRSPGGSACTPSDNGNVIRGGGRGLRATVPAWITHPQISPSSSGETRRGDSGAFARQSKEDRREERDE